LIAPHAPVAAGRIWVLADALNDLLSDWRLSKSGR